MQSKIRLNEGMQFVGTSKSGHSVVLDSVSDVGGFDSSVHPVEAMILAFGGCTSMDVVSLLRKMKQDFDDFAVLLDTERADEHPKVLTKIELSYRVWGEVDQEKFTKAIDLSLDKYCSVANTLKPNVDISYKSRINPED